MIVYHLHQQHYHIKREEKMTLMLFSHIYLYVLIETIILISMNIHTMMGDIFGSNFDSPWCIFRIYAALVSGFVMYHTFIV